MAFNVDDYISGFKPLQYFKGTDFQYFCVAKHGTSLLALNLEAARGPVPYKGKKMVTVGFGFRGIEIGEESHFTGVFGLRGEAAFKDTEGYSRPGTRLFKTYLPLTNDPCSGDRFHALADPACAKLYSWVKGWVETCGGTMLVSEAEFTAAASTAFAKIDNTTLDLFHLPGEVPDWAQPVKKVKPAADDGEEGKGGDQGE